MAADPYSIEALNTNAPPALSAPTLSPDFLLPENYDNKFRRSWGERLVYHIGVGYLIGLAAGGAYGTYHGLATTANERQRIRINAVLNNMGKRGPGWGNSIGCLGMMFSFFESVAYNARGTDDLLNVAGAGAVSGAILKSAAGPRTAGATALGFSALMTAGTFLSDQFGR